MKKFFKKNEGESHDFWMSYTDLMSGFLIVFIIASIIYYNRSNDIQKYIDENKVTLQEIIDMVNEKKTSGTLVNINKDFEDVFQNVDSIEFDENMGSIRIYPYKAKELFKSGSDTMEANLAHRLDVFGRKFVRRAMELVNTGKKGKQGKDIQEIRIEGHTDSDGSFMDNLSLSSRRAYAVYAYIHDNCNLSPSEKAFMEDKMIAVGYSEARQIDDKGGLVKFTNLPENKDNSRRIEFRIIGKDKYSKKAEKKNTNH